ncbi:hypothetical protein J4211_05640 [Candidatus Woesearchaeota archaeon]|nr:hypothetical protein [Candidatus Woesearchaeota archaeon]
METRFMIGSQARVDELTKLLHEELLPRFGMCLGNRGAARYELKNLDFAEYALMQGEQEVGRYEFELKARVYHCRLENAKLPQDTYAGLVVQVQQHFPEVKELVE